MATPFYPGHTTHTRPLTTQNLKLTGDPLFPARRRPEEEDDLGPEAVVMDLALEGFERIGLVLILGGGVRGN